MTFVKSIRVLVITSIYLPYHFDFILSNTVRAVMSLCSVTMLRTRPQPKETFLLLESSLTLGYHTMVALTFSSPDHRFLRFTRTSDVVSWCEWYAAPRYNFVWLYPSWNDVGINGFQLWFSAWHCKLRALSREALSSNERRRPVAGPNSTQGHIKKCYRKLILITTS